VNENPRDSGTPAPQAGAQPIVFLVEDDPDIRNFVAFLLEREGYELRFAADGEQALAALELPPPDLVILDLMIPFRSGYEVLAAYRKNESWSQVPVLMLTSRNREQDIARALSEGANDYLTKPFRPLELLARVKRFL